MFQKIITKINHVCSCYVVAVGIGRKRAAVRAVRGARNAGRGASPTAGKREGFSF
jgi:hypothetical protein